MKSLIPQLFSVFYDILSELEGLPSKVRTGFWAFQIPYPYPPKLYLFYPNFLLIFVGYISWKSCFFSYSPSVFTLPFHHEREGRNLQAVPHSLDLEFYC